jgi:hypothetical protein
VTVPSMVCSVPGQSDEGDEDGNVRCCSTPFLPCTDSQCGRIHAA